MAIEPMKINTIFFGQQEIDPDTIITFPNGVPGFEERKQFKLFHSVEFESLQCLQSVDDVEACFSLMEPALCGYEYEFLLSDAEMELLKISDAEDSENLIFFLMVYKADSEDRRRASDAPLEANWRSPIIINVVEKIGLQKTLSNINKITKVSGN
jgi:flagellar assembly factor FliW